MRKFVVWLDKNVPSTALIEETLKFPDTMTDSECEEECRECAEVLIDNEISVGWMEIT